MFLTPFNHLIKKLILLKLETKTYSTSWVGLISQNQPNKPDFAPFGLLFSICPTWTKKFFLGKIWLIWLILAFVFSSSSSIYIIYISLLLWKKTVITTVVKVVYIGVGSSHCNPLLSFFLHSWLLDVERNVSLLFCTLFHSTITNSFSLFTCKPLCEIVWIRIRMITWTGVTLLPSVTVFSKFFLESVSRTYFLN